MNKKYFLGLDIGTDSIGWAVTDDEYNLQKYKGKALWGIHLFEGGSTAEERRAFRSSRRRRQRAEWRQNLLRDLFREEIEKVDKDFFGRLDDSFFLKEDKKVLQSNSLFNDPDYTDKDYHNEFPTIYHLRKALIDGEKKYDIRLVYLAIEHILKHRGHFLFGGSDMETSMKFDKIYSEWCDEVYDVMNKDFSLSDTAPLEELLITSAGVTEKKRRLKEIFGPESKGLVELLSGASIKVVNVFGDEYKECKIKNISFNGDTFDKDKGELESELGEDNLHLLEKTKALYDWGVLHEILKGSKYLSEAKVKVYDKHAEDLSLLKAVIQNCAPEKYKDIFKSNTIKGNYASYVGITKKGNKKMELVKCTQDDFYAYIKKVLADFLDNDIVAGILSEIENRTFMPKQVTKENSVIPNQVHLSELKKICQNSSKHYEFLNKSDQYGTVCDKIISLLTFRIPYYVGPLNSYHGKYAWIEKLSNEKVFPWNFNDVVDLKKSSEKFIERMTNACTYLSDETVLAKNSVLYSKYMVFNELNNIKVNGIKLTVAEKTDIFNTIYLKKIQPKMKDIRNYLIKEYGKTAELEITGLADDIKANMKSYIDFKNIIGDKVSDEKMVDDIIRMNVVFGQEKEMLRARITELYGDCLKEDEIVRLSNLSYSGWGNFSRKFLAEIRSTIDNLSIIDLLMETDENLMQILHNEKYGIYEQIEEYKSRHDKKPTGTYSSISELYVSPSNKKRIWRVMVVVKEIVKVMGCEPEKIFIEMARGTDEEKKQSVSRKKQLEEMYATAKDEKELIDELGSETESSLRRKKLYLYYRQMGRCMYSGKRLSLAELDRCDIDHIIPRSVKDDDSLNNTVLVLGNLNKQKSDTYPIPKEVLGENIQVLWKLLRDKKFIEPEKYNRLVRRTPLTVDELAEFVNRQLVETRQTTKMVADIFTGLYKNSEIVYVKAKNVSAFRNGGYLTKTETGEYADEALVKVREINDYHHAKDAYLNIVVGNIYNEKFNHNPKVYISGGNHYHLANICRYDVPKANWTSGINGTITKIKKVLSKNNVLYTVMPVESSGGFFNQQLLKKGKGQFPIKTSDPRLSIEKYGGYSDVAGAYLAIIESTIKGDRVKTIESVPIYIKSKLKNDKNELITYYESQGLKDVRVVVPVLRFNTLIKYNGAFIHLTGRSNDTILCCNRMQLAVNTEKERYIKKIVKYNDSLVKDRNNSLDENHNGITADENVELYDWFTDKIENSIYNKILAAQIGNLKGGREAFRSLSLAEQNKVLFEIMRFFQCNRVASDLSLIGKAKHAGVLSINKKLKPADEFIIINQSPTGIFESEIDVSKL